MDFLFNSLKRNGKKLIDTAIMILIILFIYRIYIDIELYGIPVINYTNIIKEADTGDLIIFRWFCVDQGFRIFSKMSHIGSNCCHIYY